MQEEKPMRTLNVEEISKNIKEMCIEANHFLSKDMDIAMKNAVSTEKSPLGKKILSQLQDNLKIAGKDMTVSYTHLDVYKRQSQDHHHDRCRR